MKQQSIGGVPIPDILAPYISAPASVPFRKVEKYRGEVSRAQARADLEELRYILDNRYSGKEYWERQGISFSQCYAEIARFIEVRKRVNVSDFCRAIHKAFDVGIVDNHFCFASPMTGRLGFSKIYAAYFTELLVEKANNAYTVIKSGAQNVQAGDKITDPSCLYPTLAPVGKEYFLVGCRSWEPMRSMPVQVDNTYLAVDVHRCRASAIPRGEDVCLHRTQENGIDIVYSNCCDYVGQLTEKTDITAIGRAYADTDVLIWDNLSNQGGYSGIPRDFVLGLNGYTCREESCAELVSPVTKGRPCKRKWVLAGAEVREPEKGTYDGTLYFLMNSNTASSGESSVHYAKSLKHAIFIGENTMGCNTFGETASYRLKRSGVVLCVPHKIFLCRNPEDCAEGKGFTPDYWVDSADVRREVVRWIT